MSQYVYPSGYLFKPFQVICLKGHEIDKKKKKEKEEKQKNREKVKLNEINCTAGQTNKIKANIYTFIYTTCKKFSYTWLYIILFLKFLLVQYSEN